MSTNYILFRILREIGEIQGPEHAINTLIVSDYQAVKRLMEKDRVERTFPCLYKGLCGNMFFNSRNSEINAYTVEEARRKGLMGTLTYLIDITLRRDGIGEDYLYYIFLSLNGLKSGGNTNEPLYPLIMRAYIDKVGLFSEEVKSMRT